MTDHASERAWISAVRLAVEIIALLLIVLFIVENAQPVRVHFFVTGVETSLAWALLAAGVLGFVAGLLAPHLRRRR